MFAPWLRSVWLNMAGMLFGQPRSGSKVSAGRGAALPPGHLRGAAQPRRPAAALGP